MNSTLKKYLPHSLYIAVYKAYKYGQYIFLNKKENINLVHFTKPTLKDVTYKDISYKIMIDPENGLIDKDIYNNGIWEPEILEILKEHVQENSKCLDIGANIGQHSMCMAAIAKKGKVYSFEPLPKLVNQINQSIQANNFTNVTVCNFGLSNKNEVKEIYLDNLNIGRTTFDKRDEATSVERAEVKVFDDFWNESDRIDFMKMDVEGYEYYALQGMKKNIATYHPKMLIEFTPLFYKKMNISSEELLTFILDLGYRIYDIDQNKKEITKDTIQAFLESTPIQTNILCL
ncbi:MAG: FkbM family methyltransferase [Patescibacteria group bacterium]